MSKLIDLRWNIFSAEELSKILHTIQDELRETNDPENKQLKKEATCIDTILKRKTLVLKGRTIAPKPCQAITPHKTAKIRPTLFKT